MVRRKTINVRDLINKVNNLNSETTCKPDVRQGWCSLLESVLMDCEVYAGFGYLTQDQVPEGHLPGVVADKVNGDHTFPDESRRVYYIHKSLRDKPVIIKNSVQEALTD